MVISWPPNLFFTDGVKNVLRDCNLYVVPKLLNEPAQRFHGVFFFIGDLSSNENQKVK